MRRALLIGLALTLCGFGPSDDRGRDGARARLEMPLLMKVDDGAKAIAAGKVLAPVTPGTVVLNASATFNIPAYNTLIEEVWGAGGGGSNTVGTTAGNGGTSSGITASATAGGGGTRGVVASPGGAGGTGRGGDTNSTGATGTTTAGGSSPNGGATQSTSGAVGNSPGGGGNPVNAAGGGGGGGGYSKKTYTYGQLMVGAPIAVTVGTGGTATGNAGRGATGRVTFTWY